MNSKKRATKKIPAFATIEEEAAFWDTHDTTDFEGEFKPIEARFSRKLSEGLTLHLDADTMEALRSHAKALGVAPATVVRTWVMERLKEPTARH